MKCLFLVAGYATRLYDLAKECPKPLLKVREKTIMDWLLEDLRTIAQIEEFFLISNHKFISAFEAWAGAQSVPIHLIDNGTCSNEQRLGAVRDIRYAVDAARIDDDLLVVAGDHLLDFSLRHFVDFTLEKHSSCIMHFYEPDPAILSKGGVCELGQGGRLLSMEEKPAVPKTHWSALPYYYYTAEDVRKIPVAIAQGCGVDAPGSLAAWMCRHSVMHSMQMPGRRFDIGDPESYRKVCLEYPGIVG